MKWKLVEGSENTFTSDRKDILFYTVLSDQVGNCIWFIIIIVCL